ncbi:MAG: tetratricopeptide repeat protein [Gaiellales bacterium]
MELYDLYAQGRSHLAAGEYLAAIPPLEEARNISPAQGSIRESLAVAYLRAHRYRDALPEAQAAVDCAPNDHYAYFLLGRAHQGLGDLVAARAQYKLANWLRPGDSAYEAALAAVASAA